jgi:hypothetical protein
VHSDLVTHSADFTDCSGQRVLQRGLATTEHHGIEQAASSFEESQHSFPFHFIRAASRQQMRVVTVGAAPCATLTEDYP